MVLSIDRDTHISPTDPEMYANSAVHWSGVDWSAYDDNDRIRNYKL